MASVTNSGGIVDSGYVQPFGFTATAGRVILAVFSRRDGGVLSLPPAGYTTLASSPGGGLFSDGVAIYGKVADGGETEVDWGSGGGVEPAPSTSMFAEISGVSLSGFDSAVATSTGGTAISAVVTPTAGRDAFIYSVFDRAQDGAWSPRPVPTGAGTEINQFADDGGGHPRLIAYGLAVTAASGDSTVSATYDNPFGHNWYLLTVSLSAPPTPPTPGIWIAFANQALPFSDGAVSASDDPRLARGLPQAAPTGITDDVTTRVLKADWNRGGAYDHVGSSGPGGFSITLNNFDGRYDPDNTASPLYGKLNPGIPVWGGAIKATGALGTAAGTGAVAGFMAGIVREFVPTVRNGERICEVIGDDAFELYRRSTVSVAPSLSRSHATFRGLILDGVGEASGRRDLAIESGMLPFSAVDSGNALNVLEDLNRATATRHYIRPADTKEDWYDYVTVNKLHKLQSAADQTLDGDDIDDVSGWRVTNANTIQVQRATVEPISVTPNNAEVWVFEDTPFTVTSAARKVIWANFDDYVFDATVDTNIASGSITTTITNFGKSAKIEIWTASTAVVGLLRVLGRQVVRGDSITVVAGDEAVGALSGNTISSDYIGQEGAAQGLVDFIVWKYGQPLKRPSITVVSKNAATRSTIFERDLFDVLTLSVDKLSVSGRRMEIVGLRGSVVPGKFYSVTYELQETPNQSALDWFDVNTDSVNGSVLIAPF